MSKPLLSTHVLDTSTGKPAADIRVTLFKQLNDEWQLLHTAVTTEDGRYGQFVKPQQFTVGIYKLRFDVQEYYSKSKTATIYPYVEIVFSTQADQHYHIPLLLSPYGYSTYRGS